MATVTVTTTPTVIDDGSSAALTIENTGSVQIVVTRAWGSSVLIRPGRDADVIPAGEVAVLVNPSHGSTSTATYTAREPSPGEGSGGGVGVAVDTSELAPGLVIDGGTL